MWFETLLLPWIVLAFLYAAMYARLTRATMLDVLGEDYIRTARAKGLGERVVITRHALRSAMTPILTVFGLDLGVLLGGAVLTESTFNLPGLGLAAVQAISSKDLPVILGRDPVRGPRDRGRQPRRGPSVRRHRPASEAGMTELHKTGAAVGGTRRRPRPHPPPSSKYAT